MKNGLYKYTEKSIGGAGHIIIDIIETEKTYTFKLIENTCRYDPWRISSLFDKTNKARINKKRAKHQIWAYNNWFVIYPYRDGIPYFFEYIGEDKK